ncbi:MAG: DUF6161 domain-containing protein [Balneola sp.]
MSFQNFKRYSEFEIKLDYKTDSFSRTIKGLANIRNHFKKESKFWDDKLFNDHSTFRQFGKYFDEQFELITNFYDRNKETEKEQLEKNWETLKSILETTIINISNSLVSVISYQTPTSSFYKELIKEDPIQATIAFYYLNEIPYNFNNKMQLFDGLIKAYEFKNSKSGFKKRRIAEKISTSHILNKAQDEFDELNIEFKNFSEEYKEWFTGQRLDLKDWIEKNQTAINNSVEEGRRKISLTDKTYSDFMALKAPLTFWEKRIEQYGNSGYLWSMLLAITLIIICSGLFKLLYDPPQMFGLDVTSFNPTSIKTIFLYATLVSFAVYFVRTCARMVFSAFHLKRDAEERHQLTMVYLSLKERGDISDQERDLILQALFSRVDTGLLKGDNSPTMPGANSIIEKFTRN